MKHVTPFFLITLICPMLSVAMDEAPASGKGLPCNHTEADSGVPSKELKERGFKKVIDDTQRLKKAIEEKRDALPGDASDDDETGKQKRSCERLLGLTAELESLFLDLHEQSSRKDPWLTLLEKATSGLEFVNEAPTPQILNVRIKELTTSLVSNSSQATGKSGEKDWTLL